MLWSTRALGCRRATWRRQEQVSRAGTPRTTMFGGTQMIHSPRRLLTALAVTTLVGGSALISAAPAFAATTTYYASPSGSGTGCTSSAPCSISQVKTAVRQNQASAAPTDVVV